MIDKLHRILKSTIKSINTKYLKIIGLVEKDFMKKKSNSIFINWIRVISLTLLLFLAGLILPGLTQSIIFPITKVHPNKTVSDSIAYNKVKTELEKEVLLLEKKLDAFTPKSHYLIINSTNNEFLLMKGKQLVREGKCSTGSYLLLEKGDNQKWLFKTPKGELRIRSKKTAPVWKKPDWAFVEEGLPIPSANHESRYEYGVLGDYALVLGDGYMIHGTIYQRFLGLPVTHGCVRLNDDDLKKVYQTMEIGSKVYVY